MRRAIILAASAWGLLAQSSDVAPTFAAISTRAAVTSDKLTLQQNQDQPAYAQAVRAVVNATVSGTVVVEMSGTAPTATALTIQPTNQGASFSRLRAYGASDVGAGTPVSVTYTLTANVPLVLDMTGIALNGKGTTRNLTIATSLGGSGNVQTALYWREQP